MHNTVTTGWHTTDPSPRPGDEADGARRRLCWLAAMFVGVLLVIAGRLAYLQLVLPPGLIAVFDETTETFEEIPARDGRILTADGRPLADNVESYDLLVDYRWLEEPADADWLRHQARSRLSRAERRDPAQLAAAEAAVIARREELWSSLAELTRLSPAALSTERARIQQRVEKIWQRVQEHRQQQWHGHSTSATEQSAPTIWGRLYHEITTPPPRNLNDPLVIAEQEQDHLLLSNLEADAAAEIESHPELYPGLRIVLRTRRIYPEGDLAAHLIGSRTAIQPEEINELSTSVTSGESLQPGDTIGRSGLERSYDAQLRGQRGLKRIVRNRRREIIQTEVVREAVHGQDLLLTFDAGLQQQTEHLLDTFLNQPATAETDPPPLDDESSRSTLALTTGPRGACIVALDVRTGAVLAAAAAPRFDVNLLIHSDTVRWQAVLDDPRRPLFPRVTQMALPPGSIFKALSAIALIESGELDPEARFLCQGYLDRPDKDRCLVFRHYGVGHNETNLADALGRSCNVYFFMGARQAGPRPLIEWSRKLGIGQPTGIDLPGEAAGHLPSPDQPAAKSKRKWYPGDTLGLVIGQSSLLVTPLQMARLMAAIANDGQLVTPHLAAGTGQLHSLSESGATLGRPQPKPITGLHPETLSAVRKGLERVVQHKTGTAYKTVRLSEVTISGKTGTAETGSRLPDHAWFAGYVPADEPKVAFVVVIEHGGSGGKVAGPVARDFVKLLLARRVIDGSRELAEAQDE